MATEAHLLTKSVLEHRKSIASKTKSWPSVSGHDFERRKTFAVEMGALARPSDIQRSFLSGASGDTELFEKRSNINGFWLSDNKTSCL